MTNCKLLLLFGIVIGSPAIAYDHATAIDAYESGDYQTAHEQFTLLAKNNDAEAQYNLAFMFYGGEGVKQDDKQAIFWFAQAAKLGHAQAQDKLAYMYLNGRGVGIDHVQAYAWYTLAAENGVFLAKNISKKLIKQMSPAERTHAELLSREYLEQYQ
ncbi:MAG: hypothetical protein DHS20C09_16450 [marine bacterium B5-7]|nr:MAG: hypothetical protein DHS20C09_16450 [marine bacterium B5-7]